MSKCEMLANSLDRQLPGVVACTYEARHTATILTGVTHPKLNICSCHAAQLMESQSYKIEWNQLRVS
jgi:hypothetical protein